MIFSLLKLKFKLGNYKVGTYLRHRLENSSYVLLEKTHFTEMTNTYLGKKIISSGIII